MIIKVSYTFFSKLNIKDFIHVIFNQLFITVCVCALTPSLRDTRALCQLNFSNSVCMCALAPSLRDTRALCQLNFLTVIVSLHFLYPLPTLFTLLLSLHHPGGTLPAPCQCYIHKLPCIFCILNHLDRDTAVLANSTCK